MQAQLNSVTQQANALRGESDQLKHQLSQVPPPSVTAEMQARLNQIGARNASLEDENQRQKKALEHQDRVVESLRKQQSGGDPLATDTGKSASTVTLPAQPRSFSPFGSVAQGTASSSMVNPGVDADINSSEFTFHSATGHSGTN